MTELDLMIDLWLEWTEVLTRTHWSKGFGWDFWLYLLEWWRPCQMATTKRHCWPIDHGQADED